MKAIFLIGYMGSGKTTLGQELAQVMGLRFVDLDDFIENRCQMSISDLFASRGESGFRSIEREMLAEVALMEDVVVACGGGTPCFHGNMELMNAAGTTVWLEVAAERLASRLCLPGMREKRPLIAGKSQSEVEEYVSKALVGRVPHYALAHIKFDATDIETAETNHATAVRLANLLKN